MDDLTTAPHGTWPSPLSAADLAAGGAQLTDLCTDGEVTYWLQSDPSRGGRYAVWRHTAGQGAAPLSGEELSPRTRVHEYGGGALGVGHGVVLAASWDDQRLYRMTPEGSWVPVTPEPQEAAGIRWQSPHVLPGGTAAIVVRETHGADRPRDVRNVHGHPEAVNELVRLDLTTGHSTVLVTGPDFVAGGWPDPTGRRIAYLTWDHPDMPWDAAALWVAELTEEGVGTVVHVAGGRGAADGTPGGGAADEADRADGGAPGAAPTSAVAEAAWLDADRLAYAHDLGGWSNVHFWTDGDSSRWQDEEVESAVVRWVPSSERLSPLPGDGGDVVWTAASADGTFHLRGLRPGTATVLEGPGVTAVSALRPRRSDGAADLVMIAAGPTMSPAVLAVDPATGATTVLSSLPESPAAGIGAIPRPVTFPTSDGEQAHALAYAPTSTTHRAPAGEAPPLIVLSHGGPTGAAVAGLNPTAQYWASRGFAVVDVNYRGSAGYGRAYRDALQGRWGILDVADCIDAARHLAFEGLADPDRLIIEGGSAGGYTTLLALCTTDTFAAGGCSFGVSDLRALARDTHKFESRYLDGLIGAWPEDEAVYVERSPLSHVGTLSTPMIVLQGDEDAVVPPSQSEEIVAALRDRGITHAYLLFEGEQHGFRRPENQARALEARLAFYGAVLGFTPADAVELPELVTGSSS